MWYNIFVNKKEGKSPKEFKMKEFKSRCKILKVERANNSYYGNPSFHLVVLTEDGECISGKTASNAVIGYEISYNWENQEKSLVYHFTEKGNCIFDRIIDLK